MVGILDYGAGNVKSVLNALAYLEVPSNVVTTRDEIQSSDALIFPGVGHFGFVMDSLCARALDEPLKKHLTSHKPFLGICIGMQVLYEESEEAPGVHGLGVFPGTVTRFREGRVPHIGWNEIVPDADSRLLRRGWAYFVNSYAPRSAPADASTAHTNYYSDFVSAAVRGAITAVQFHPEKSGDYGIEFLKNWCALPG